MNRVDGWPGLQRHYALPQADVRGLDHDLAYRGLEGGSLDVIDLYATDAEIRYYGIRPLADDGKFFPAYRAVYLYRTDLEARHPGAAAALEALAGAIGRGDMTAMNAAVKIDGRGETAVAAEFLAARLGLETDAAPRRGVMQRLLRNTRDHLVLVGVSLGAAICVAIPLGIAAARRPALGRMILSVAGILQTVPSLALLVFMIPLLGIGGPPAVAALFLYSLLPIIRNTHSGLHDIPAPLLESAVALGLSPGARLRLIELPLAARSILAGIKTSAVINVGTATLGALVGAGGYGQPILTGIRLDDMGLIFEGAVPAAVLALLVQGTFDLVERRLLPAGLRYRAVS
jgi:osmoprotectant transport system permease protein